MGKVRKAPGLVQERRWTGGRPRGGSARGLQSEAGEGRVLLEGPERWRCPPQCLSPMPLALGSSFSDPKDESMKLAHHTHLEISGCFRELKDGNFGLKADFSEQCWHLNNT